MRRTERGPTSADILLFWPPVCPWMNWSCTVICSLSLSWWDHNVSITFVVACGLPRLALSHGLFSHHFIPQARGMCSVCPKNGTHCSSLCVKTPVLEMVWLRVRDWERCWEMWACLTGDNMFNLENKRDRDKNFVNRADEPEFDPTAELGTHWRDRLQLQSHLVQDIW